MSPVDGALQQTRRMTGVAAEREEFRSPLLNAMSRKLKLRHYSSRTVHSYVRWVIRYIRFHGTRHPPSSVKTM
jgi:hypothetical protein